jgi:hypothetical protein
MELEYVENELVELREALEFEKSRLKDSDYTDVVAQTIKTINYRIECLESIKNQLQTINIIKKYDCDILLHFIQTSKSYNDYLMLCINKLNLKMNEIPTREEFDLFKEVFNKKN